MSLIVCVSKPKQNAARAGAIIMTTSDGGGSSALRAFRGDIVLVGAGKMGAAMLDGWIGLGLDAARVAVLEPQPSPDIAALASRGLRLNPDRTSISDPA